VYKRQIVEGSLVQEGHQIRVHAQLIRAATDEHIWAGEYQREYHGILEVQEEVARNIVEQIELNLTPEERARLASRPPVDPQAVSYTHLDVYKRQAFVVDDLRWR